MTAGPELPRLRPEPWPVTPFGPYRLAAGGGNKLVKFPTVGDRVIRWIERNCVFTDGKWLGQPVRLLPWQRQLLLDLFEMVYDEELKRWRRKYRTALIGVPKKQGKALALNTPIPTPGGWTTMGELAEGDEVFDDRGQRCRVTLATEVMLGHPCYRVRFSDGSWIDADADHLWHTETLFPEGGSGIKTTLEIAQTLTRKDGARNHAVAAAGPLDLPARWLPIDPYVLGAWLGDGRTKGAEITSADPEVLEQIRLAGYPVRPSTPPIQWRIYGGLQRQLRQAGVFGSKHIPGPYLRASIAQRTALLQGLMDTDGSVSTTGQCEFTTTSGALASDVTELLVSLGFKPLVTEGRALLAGVDHGPKWRIRFYAFADNPVFRLPRKAARQKQRPSRRARSERRHIVAVEPIESVPVRCIQVDSPSRLYLAGRSMIPTHNTELAAFIALWFMLASGQMSPGIAVAAAAEYQADLVFGAAARCVEHSPTLSRVCQVFAREIQVPGAANARIRKVAAAGGKLDGMKLVANVYDELHEWVTPNQRKVFGMLRGALALAEEPLNLMITTAGEDDGEQDEEAVAPWLRMYRYGKLLEAGELKDEAFFFRWWSSAPGTDPRDMEALKRCNPSFGVTVREAFYLDEFTKRTPSELLRYYHNLPVETVNIWLEHGTWEACRVSKFELDPHAPSWLGWDASTKRDSTGIVVVQRVEERLRVHRWSWERPVGSGGEPVKDWKVPRNEVLAKVRELYATLNIVAGGYDPHAIAWVAEDLENEGLALFEWPQTDQHMCPATQALYEAIIDGVLAHDGDPVLERHIKAAKVKNTPRGGQRLVKSEAGRKIDCAIALVIAIGVMEKRPEEPKGVSFYMPGDEEEDE